MKQYRLPNGLVMAALAGSIILTGASTTIMARERDGEKRARPRAVQQTHKTRTVPSTSRQVHRSGPVHKSKVTVHSSSPRITRALPSGYRTIRTPGRHYYFHKGKYYRRHPHGFEIVSVPRFYHLPPHARRVIANRIVYFVCDDVWYTAHDGYYEICEAPHVHGSLIFEAGPLRFVLTDH